LVVVGTKSRITSKNAEKVKFVAVLTISPLESDRLWSGKR
jgi:hypothetical protein